MKRLADVLFELSCRVFRRKSDVWNI